MGNNYRFCPDNLYLKDLVAEKETAWLPKGFSIELQSPDSPISLEELGGMSEPPDIKSATGISVQEFYKRIIMESELPVCFDTPIDFWPK